MEEIPWTKFIREPKKYLGKVGAEFKVVRGDGSYLRVKYFSPYREDMAIKRTKIFKRERLFGR